MTTLIERFSPVLRDAHAPTDRDPRLLLDRDGPVSIYYAPFEHLNREARVALVGITPGPTQMLNACRAARQVLLAGGDHVDAVRAGKSVGAFSGEPMRGNLVRQLNHWGVHEWLGLEDSAELFSVARDRLQTTSLLRYPVFHNDAPYAGTPDMLRHPLLRAHLMQHFVREVEALQDALFVALGPTVQRVLQALVVEGRLPPQRLALGMLHPSANCTYRIDYLTGRREGPLPHATRADAYDRGRERFRALHLASVRHTADASTNLAI